MNQNNRYPQNKPRTGQTPTGAPRPASRPSAAGQRPTSSTSRPVGSTPRPTSSAARPASRPAAAGSRPTAPRKPIVTPPKSRFPKTTVIGLALLFVFVLCFSLYSCQFLIPSSDEPVVTDPQSDEPTVTDPPATQPVVTQPPATEPPATKPPVTEPPATSQTPGPDDPPADAYVVVLDPGHGFWDGGCSNESLGNWVEKTLTLDICRRIAPILEAEGIYVIFTHDGETFPSCAEIDALAAKNGFSIEDFVRKLIHDYGFDKNNNPVNENDVWNTFKGNLLDTGSGKNIFNTYERAYYVGSIAAKRHIDAMVSVHVNSVDVTNPNIDATKFHGMTVSYCTSNDRRAESMKLQKSVADALAASFPEKKLIRYADPWYDSLVVCKYSDAPTILIETGYATDPTDAADLVSDAWRQKLAESIAAGIIASLG